ncbi:MAG: hydrogenase expression/formation protein HypE [Calditrichaeota bacterium]|nr:MAG: hydrogenase expression/formation protein HypE [Calditrichota bacterium]
MKFVCPMPIEEYDAVTLGHGGGGKLTNRLIRELLEPTLNNPFLAELHDGAMLPRAQGRLAVTTDSYVVSPPFFPGGNIGDLAVHGTLNDLAMCGARPLYLTLAMILEEGFLLQDLWRILASIRQRLEEANVPVVTGDTKVVERGKGDGVFLNTTGVGQILDGVDVRPARIQPGDAILLSGPIAEHGIAILSIREGLSFDTALQSDTANLWPVVEALLDAGGLDIHALRDATRGGVASALNELAQASGTGMVIQEEAIPVREEVRGACEILGLDPLFVANEGRFLAFVAPERADELLEVLHSHPLGGEARIIGRVVSDHPGVVRMETWLGGSRVVDMLSGEQLPRIC